MERKPNNNPGKTVHKNSDCGDLVFFQKFDNNLSRKDKRKKCWKNWKQNKFVQNFLTKYSYKSC